MKINKLYIPALALAMAFTACDDQTMEWDPSIGTDVTKPEIPLELQEQIDNYDFIKNYVAKHHPGFYIGLGMGADNYITDAKYREVVDQNFNSVTFGNAMKHQSVVKSNGDLDFSKIDEVVALMPSDLQLYGHNFIWHTQQNQTYLKSLIAPEMKIETTGDEVCINVVGNTGFENGNADGYTGLWGKYEYAVEQPGHESDYCIHFTMTDETTVNHDCQLFWTLDAMLVDGETYAYEFWVKSDANLAVQFMGQNASYGGIYKDTFTAGSDWTYCTGEFTYNAADAADIERVGIQFGGTPLSNLWFDDFKFGVKNESEPKAFNYCTNGDFSNGTEGWTLNSGNDATEVVEITSPGGSAQALKMVAPETVENAWDLEIVSPKMPTLPGKKVNMSFWVMADQAGKGRVAFEGLTNSYPYMPWLHPEIEGYSWTEAFELEAGTWTHINLNIFDYNDNDFNADATEWCMKFDFGYLPGVTYHLADVEITEITDEPAAAPKRASSITYILKTPEEKRAILLDAMEKWIKGMCEHMGDRVYAWDVINEPISDGSAGLWRGFDGTFNGEDSEPVESTETGLNLNWSNETGNGHFYWGYYIGRDYAAQAFKFARQYAKPDAKLYVNDYGLESNPAKLAALIDFVKYIDNSGIATVDGIGTQMHVHASSITRENVDAMFKTMAATGKLVRITELDVAVKPYGSDTYSPTADDLMKQAEIYKFIVESYFENVPEAQQGGIVIWTLTDDAKEHEYWLKGDYPNLFNADFTRKPAYKGVCDAIAGYDISTELDGTMWGKPILAAEDEEETPAE